MRASLPSSRISRPLGAFIGNLSPLLQCRARSQCSRAPENRTLVQYPEPLVQEKPMLQLDDHPSGRHFLQIPGPTNVPDRILRALDHPTIDHRGPEFARMTLEILEGLKEVFKTNSPIIIYAASGTGAWEAALVNAISPGDRVLMFE